MTLIEQVAALVNQIQSLTTQSQILAAKTGEHEAVIARMGQDVHQHEQDLRPARSAPLLNRRQAERMYSPAAMRKQLGAGGAAPLDLSGLKGTAADIQPAAIPEVPQLPQLGDASVKQGTMLKAGDVTYRRGANDWEPLVAPASKGGGGVSQPTGAALDLQPVPGPGSGAWVASGSFEARPVTSTVGTLWIETSRSTIASQAPMPIYQYQAAGWAFIGGMFYRTQAQLATLAATLTASDAGLVVYVASPYCHRLLWSGAAWGWADPADSSGRYAFWPSAPADGWHAADGSTVAVLRADGSVANVTLIDAVTNNLYLRSGAYLGTVVAAVAPTTTAVSAGTPSGTVSQPTLTMNSYTPAGTVSQPTFTGSALGTHYHELPFANAGITLYLDSIYGAPIPHTLTFTNKTTLTADGISRNVNLWASSAVSAGTPAGTVSQPSFSGSPATLTGTVSQPTFTGNLMGTHVHAISLGGGDPVQHSDCPLSYRL